MEKIFKPISGWAMLILALLLLISGLALIITKSMILVGILLIVVTITLITPGFIAIEPNSTRVLTLFGKYVGTVKESGFFYANPFYTKKKVSQRAETLDLAPIKVNDKQGNPIMIGAIVVWKVDNTFKATFDVERYDLFVHSQSEAALRKMAMAYSYDNFEDATAEITLRSSSEEVNELLEREVTERLALAGIHVIEARISHLAYATEIAGAMLQRQQATAIVAARNKIVEGAVGMVEMALEELSKKDIVNLDEEKKAAMVSNLMVVLCGDKNAQPVLNTGTLHQ
ncbi:MAG: SPFH domain-containing protein [Saprospiraceae bacterium]|jgi:regulator of protease activity HflC (stomatin/prohibitin superfamily)